MPPGEPERAVRSPSEIVDAIRDLAEADWHTLRKIAASYARTCPLETHDLLQDAFARALGGDRHCPAQISIIRFVAQAMRSIASDSVKGARRKQEAPAGHSARRPASAVAAKPELIEDCSPTPEDALAAEQEVARIKDAILHLFDDDLIAQAIIKGDMEETEAEEIRALTGLDKVAYASKRRFIRRRIDQAFPEGWKP